MGNPISNGRQNGQVKDNFYQDENSKRRLNAFFFNAGQSKKLNKPGFLTFVLLPRPCLNHQSTMKNNTSPVFHFSAYPLSVIGGTSTSKLKVSRSANGICLKVLPALDVIPARIKLAAKEPDTVLQAHQWDIGWFNNYE